MIHSCDLCGKVYEDTPEKMEMISKVCSLDCLETHAIKSKGFGTFHEVNKRLIPHDIDPHPGAVRDFKDSMRSYRSRAEVKMAQVLTKMEAIYSYEPLIFYMKIAKKISGYVPDFMTPGLFIEVKGMWTLEGKKKVKAFHETFPKITLLVFNDKVIDRMKREANARIRRHSR